MECKYESFNIICWLVYIICALLACCFACVNSFSICVAINFAAAPGRFLGGSCISINTEFVFITSAFARMEATSVMDCVLLCLCPDSEKG